MACCQRLGCGGGQCCSRRRATLSSLMCTAAGLWSSCTTRRAAIPNEAVRVAGAHGRAER
eukprot:1119967-Pleurochrysis_carterae.AAC.1